MESRTKAFGHRVHQILIVFPLGLLATAVRAGRERRLMRGGGRMSLTCITITRSASSA